MKSMIFSVFLNAYAWGPKNLPHLRFLAASHNERNSTRDNLKCRRLIESDWYQSLWGDRVQLTGDQNAKTKFENTATGFRESTPFTSMTGVRADIVILDDPMSVDDAMSDKTRDNINLTFRESLPTRLNNPDSSAIIVIMQRLHEEDTSGVILSGDYGYEHLCLPMRFDPERKCETSIGFVDPRTEPGELLFPERFPEWVVDRDEAIMGPIATAGQMQQSPIPRGGSILKREYWGVWEEEKFPAFEYVLASADTAYTEKEENDPTGFTIWGVYRDKDDKPRVMLCWAWAKHCELHGKPLEKKPNESKRAFDIRSMPSWGLVEWIAYSCRRFRVDKLLIEAKASGITVAQEMQRLYREDGWQIELVKPLGDKVARAHAVEPAFAAGLVFAPDEDWVERVIAQCEVFPKGKHDDLCFVAGTKIATKRGLIPIESITVKDNILTPLGWKAVKAAGFTGVRPVISSAGLVGTKDHPIFTFDNGFVPLSRINGQSKLSGLTLCGLMRTALRMKSNLKEPFTDEWAESADTICRNQNPIRGDDRRRACTWRFGSIGAGRSFRQTMRFITKTAILLISSLTIWSAYRKACIAQCLRTTARLIWSTLLELGQKLPHGILLQKGLSGTDTMRPVFNLTVEGCPVYYANGVLVHNCDSLTQALQWLRKSGLISHNFEIAAELRDALAYRPEPRPLYDA